MHVHKSFCLFFHHVHSICHVFHHVLKMKTNLSLDKKFCHRYSLQENIFLTVQNGFTNLYSEPFVIGGGSVRSLFSLSNIEMDIKNLCSLFCLLNVDDVLKLKQKSYL